MQFAGNVCPESACKSLQSDLGILCSLTYTSVATDSVRGQRWARTACANEQADQGLRCPQITKGSFSYVVHQLCRMNGSKPACTSSSLIRLCTFPNTQSLGLVLYNLYWPSQANMYL